MGRLRHILLRLGIVSIALAVTCTVAPGGIRIVGYYPDWSKGSFPPSAIAYDKLTHIAHAFIAPNADGSLDVGYGFVSGSLIQTAHNHGVKVVVSLGGWGNCDGFSPMSADTAARRKFVSALLAFCSTNGYDGADIDWEYPANATDRANLTKLVHELRLAFSVAGLSLSITVPATSWSGQWFDLGAMKSDLDWIGIMTYDFYGTWTPTSGPNAALYGTFATNPEGWIDYSFGYYSNTRGVPAAKLLIGVPFYGWSYNASAMYGASTGASQLPYSSVVAKISAGWKRCWDTVGQVPYLINPSSTNVISYDDSASVALKGAYVKGKNAGGAIIWAIGQDYVGGHEPLLESFAAAAGPKTELPGGDALLPLAFDLAQNYPNPFNGGTRIRFSVPRPGRATLQVYDILGRSVATLLDGETTGGTHMALFSGPSLPSGVYIYRLTWQGHSLARTMMVLR